MLDAEFYAPDIDEPNTPNSQVRYEILSIEPGESKANSSRSSLHDAKTFPPSESVENENPKDYQDLFSIISFDNKFGRLVTAKPVRGFSGKWKIEIRVSAKPFARREERGEGKFPSDFRFRLSIWVISVIRASA